MLVIPSGVSGLGVCAGRVPSDQAATDTSEPLGRSRPSRADLPAKPPPDPQQDQHKQTSSPSWPPPHLQPCSPSRLQPQPHSYSLARMTMSMPQKMLMIQPTMTMAVRIWMRAARCSARRHSTRACPGGPCGRHTAR